MKLPKKVIVKVLLMFFPILLVGQDQSSFVEQINKCYSNPNFKDILYRIGNEKECYRGLKFPDFELSSINGETISNQTIEGKVTVINFWFTACPPCLEEIPKFNRLINEINNRRNEEIVFIAPSSDDEETILKFLKQYGELRSIILPNALSFFRTTLASKSGFPTTIVVDKSGNIKEYHSGGINDFGDFRDLIISLTSDE